MDDGAVTDLKTNEYRVSSEELRNSHVLPLLVGGYSSVWGQSWENNNNNTKTPQKPRRRHRAAFGMVFIHTWNEKSRLR